MVYGYLCEDSALENFIDEVLIHLGPKTKCKEFIRHNDFCYTYKSTSGRNSSQVRKLFADAAKRAIGTYDIDLFIVAYDYDKVNVDHQHEDVVNDHLNSIHVKARSRVVFAIPIQSIEYWLWYIKHSNESPPLVPNSLENNPDFNRDKAKSDVYNKELQDGKYPGQSNETESKYSKDILKNINTDKLQILSPSFKNFVDKIIEFCRTH